MQEARLSILHCASRGVVSTWHARSLIPDDDAAAIAAVTSLMQSKIPSSSPTFPSFTCQASSLPPPLPSPHVLQKAQGKANKSSTSPVLNQTRHRTGEQQKRVSYWRGTCSRSNPARKAQSNCFHAIKGRGKGEGGKVFLLLTSTPLPKFQNCYSLKLCPSITMEMR